MTDESNASGITTPCTFPSCLSAQTAAAAATAGEEIKRLWAEVKGTAKKLDECRIDRASAEHKVDRLTAELEEARKEIIGLKAWKAGAEIAQEDDEAAAYRRGVEEGQQWGLKWVKSNWSSDWGGTICRMEEAIRSASSAPQRNTAECQVCEWTLHRDQYSDMFHTSCGRAWDKGQDDVEFCPFCGKRVNV